MANPLSNSPPTVLQRYTLAFVGQILALMLSEALGFVLQFLIFHHSKFNRPTYAGTAEAGLMYYMLWQIFSGQLFLALFGPIIATLWRRSETILRGIIIFGELFVLAAFDAGHNPLPTLVIMLGASPAAILLWVAVQTTWDGEQKTVTA